MRTGARVCQEKSSILKASRFGSVAPREAWLGPYRPSLKRAFSGWFLFDRCVVPVCRFSDVDVGWRGVL